MFFFCTPKKKIEPNFEEGYTIFKNFFTNCCEAKTTNYVSFSIFVSAFATYLRYIDKSFTNLNYCYIKYAHNNSFAFLRKMREESSINWELSPGFYTLEGIDTTVIIGIDITSFIMLKQS
jgi:hypothetical protein